jgi:hypothetical protein
MTKKQKGKCAPRPATGPEQQELAAIEDLKATLSQAVVALNGALNITSAGLKRHMDEGFRELKELIGKIGS